MESMILSISSEVKNIVKVEDFIDKIIESFEINVSMQGRISLTIIEAVNNAILSGNKLSKDKKVDIIAIKKGKNLLVSVIDEGEGFDFTNIPDPTIPGNVGKEAGRGLYVMKMLSDDMFFENKGSKVTLVYNL